MKKLSLLCALLLIVGAAAHAHEGAISIYTDQSLNSCSLEIPIGMSGDLMILYVRDEGVDMGNAAEFRVQFTTPLLMAPPPTWESYITIALVDSWPGNVSLTGTAGFGCTQAVVPLGSFTLINIGDPDTFFVKVVDHPRGVLPDGIYITACDDDNTEVEVLGGAFVLTGNDDLFPANCNPGVESKSWGAIKSMYR